MRYFEDPSVKFVRVVRTSRPGAEAFHACVIVLHIWQHEDHYAPDDGGPVVIVNENSITERAFGATPEAAVEKAFEYIRAWQDITCAAVVGAARMLARQERWSREGTW